MTPIAFGLTALASVAWLTLALVRLQHLTLMNALLAALAALTAWRLIARQPARREGAWYWRALAWGAALLPFALQATTAPSDLIHLGVLLQVSGLGLTLWALHTLGQSFGIAPADRGLQVHGPYRWIRHPAYSGELCSLLGFGLTYPSLWNAGVLVVMTALFVGRALAEERVINRYAVYAAQVRWRLCPGVW